MRYAYLSVTAIFAVSLAWMMFPTPDTGGPVPERPPVDLSGIMTWEQQMKDLHDRCLIDLGEIQEETEKNPTPKNWKSWSYYIDKCKRLEWRKR